MIGGGAEEFAEAGFEGGGGFGDETSGVGEVDVRGGCNEGEVECRVVVVARERVAGAAAVWVDHGGDGGVWVAGGDVSGQSCGGLGGKRIGAGEEEDVVAGVLPKPSVCGDEFEPAAGIAQVVDEVGADPLHDLPEWFLGTDFAGAGKSAEQGEIDGGNECGEGIAVDAEAAGGFVGPEDVEPFGGFEPIAEFTGVVVDAEVHEDE